VIKVNISEIKNRLSYYLKLVKGGEEIEIIDRKTPLARIIRIGDMLEGPEGTSWVKEVYSLGIVTPPHKRHVCRVQKACSPSVEIETRSD